MRHHRTKNGFGRTIAALLGGCLLAAPFLLLMAALTVWLGKLPQAVMCIPAGLGWGLAAFRTAHCTGRRRRHHGLLLGLLWGSIFWGIRCIGALLLGLPRHAGMLAFLAWLLLTGMLGGITGVNARCPAKDR